MIKFVRRLQAVKTEMREPLYPLLCQIKTRVWLTKLSRQLRPPATLGDIREAELEHLAKMGVDWVWFLSIWPTGLAGQRVSQASADCLQEFKETLPDLGEEDIASSGFAITGYTDHPALARLRYRFQKYGLRFMHDFVPNHTGVDHPWAEDHSKF